MNSNDTQITISSYRRIISAGYDIEVRQQSHQFRVLLKCGPENLAVAFAPRGGGMTADVALDKAKLNTWGPTSGFYAVMAAYADIAEAKPTTRPQQ